MNSSRRLKLRKIIASLASPPVEVGRQADRLRFIERDIGLPVKLVVWALLFYFLFFSTWFEGLSKVGDMKLATGRQFFWIYLMFNFIAAFVLFQMKRLPFRLVQRVMFVSNLIDGLFLAVVTVVTGGTQSIAYWVFLALILRNAFSFPVASLQLSLNLLIIGCYLSTTLIDKAITDFDVTTSEIDRAANETNVTLRARSPRHVTHPTDRSARASHLPAKASPVAPAREEEPDPQFLVMRIFLLLLMTACGYGVQVLLDRQRRAEEEAREFALRQEQLRSAGRLAAEIAHQMKNPLGIINNAAFALQRSVKEGRSTITQQIQIIREEVERSDRIITELIGYAQLAEGQVEKLDVTQELDRAIAQVLPAAANYQIELRRDYGVALPPVMFQRRHLAEVFVNLLQNAREALEGRGIIEVTAHYGEDYSVAVTIADNGPGIPSELREKIFDAYFTTKEKGTGLGLSIVKHNVETYGGRVQVESELGKGTRFILVFPGRTLMKLRK